MIGGALILLAENLRRAHKAAAVDPLIEHLRQATAARFRRQFRRIKVALAPLRKAWPNVTYSEVRQKTQNAIVINDPQFARAFNAARAAAHEVGAEHVAEQLGALKEAGPRRRLASAGVPRTAADLEAELDSTTDRESGDRLKDAFKDALAPASFAAVLGTLRQQFAQYADGVQGQTSRAETVAVTEISGAYHGGGSDAAKETPGEVEKTWDVEDDPCPICQANADMGAIPDDALFDSGDFEPPAHPNCRCSLSYAAVSSK